MHTEALLKHVRLIGAYSSPCITHAYLQPYHVPGPSVFRTGDIPKLCEALMRHIQNPAIVRTVYSGVFRT